MSLSNLANAVSLEADLHLAVSEAYDKTISTGEKQLSLFSKIKYIFSHITVEPVILCYIIPAVMSSITTQNLNLAKACRVSLKLNDSICEAISLRNKSGYNSEDQDLVQTTVTSMISYKMFIQGLFPTLLLLFVGSWSDRTKRRKPCILIPICGEVVACIGFLFCTYFFMELSLGYTILFEAIPTALTGGWFCMFVGVYSYVSGKCEVKSRTVRIGAVSTFVQISITIGISLSGIVYKKFGFYGVYSLALLMYCSAILYGFVVIKDEPCELEPKDKEKKRKNIFRDFFDLKHVSSTFKICFKEGPNNRKKKISIVFIIIMIMFGPQHGEMSVNYLYTIKKFNWTEINYSIFNTIHFILTLGGTIFSLAFFSKYLKLDDACLGMIAITSKMLSSLVYALVPEGKYFYLGAVVEMLSGTSHVAVRSIMSKLVPPEELGQTNSMFAVCEAVVPLMYGPLYTQVYRLTMKQFPGAYFLLTAGLTFPAFFLLFWLYRQNKNDEKTATQKLISDIYQKETLLKTKENIVSDKSEK